jgi:hypothetical protein
MVEAFKEHEGDRDAGRQAHPADRAGAGRRLTYAEIARRLDRPTSTIMREVMCNGGPTAY